MEVELLPRLFSVDEYHRIVDAGLFDDERVELIAGVVLAMPPIGVAHWTRQAALISYLSSALGDAAKVYGPLSIPLGNRDEPEPDLAILANLPYSSLGRPPTAGEIYVTIELSLSSLSSLARDTRAKRTLYAHFGIRDYLVVDLARDQLRHYSDPRDGDYAVTRILGKGQKFSIAALPDIEFESDPFLAM